MILPKKLMLLLALGSYLASPLAIFAQTATQTNCEDQSILDKITYDVACKTALGGDEKADQSCKAIQCYLDNAKNRPATNQWWNPSLTEFSSKVFDTPNSEIFGERYTYAQVNWIINSIFTLFLPRANKMEDVINLFNLTKQLETGQVPTQLQPLADIFSYPFAHPVASIRGEVDNLLSKLEVASPVSAQGVGYAKLTGSNNIRVLWTATRNMAYLFSIILLIAAGFMTMFRMKINPQAVVSVQVIIPKLIISLILITFSLAIVGLVLDIIYVVIAAFLGFMNINGTFTGNLTADIRTLLTAPASYIGRWFLRGYLIMIYIIIIVMLILQTVSIPYVGGLLYALFALLLALLIWAATSLVRILVTLFQAYLNLVILTITGPLQIMADIAPTQKSVGFVPWIKCVIGNASVFVMTAVLVVFAVVLFDFGKGAGLNLSISGIDPNFTLPFLGNRVFLLGDITRVGTYGPWSGGGYLLGALFLPMAFFSAMPTLMVSIKNQLCKDTDPSQQISDAINSLVKQLTGKGPAQPKRLTSDGQVEKQSFGWGPFRSNF